MLSNNTTVQVFPAQAEPTGRVITMSGMDHMGNITIKTGMLQWINKAPLITGETKQGYAFSPLTFSTNAVDTGTTLTYQRYTGANCIINIAGETGNQYTIKFDIPYTGTYSYKAQDSQGLSACATVTGVWNDVNTSVFSNLNQTIDLQGNTTTTFTGIAGTIIQQGKIGTCSSDGLNTYYT